MTMSPKTLRAQEAADVQTLLLLWYKHKGRTSGTIIKRDIHGEPKITGMPMSHLAIMKKIRDELKGRQKQTQAISGNSLKLFETIIKRFDGTIFQLRDALPRMIEREGGYGGFYLNQLINAERLRQISSQEIIENNGMTHLLTKNSEDEIICQITGQIFQPSDLIVLKEKETINGENGNL